MNILLTSLLASVISLYSPDANLKAEINTDDVLSYSLTLDGTLIIADSPLSMELSGGEIWGKGKVRTCRHSSVNETLQSPYYRKSRVKNEYNEVRVEYKGGCSVVFRAYDDCFAWRFETRSRKPYCVKSETATFNFTADYGTYVSYTHKYDGTLESQYCDDFENVYAHSSISGWDRTHLGHLPLMVELPQGRKAVITESDLHSYPGMFLYNEDGGTCLSGRFAPVPDSLGTGGHNMVQEKVLTRKEHIAECDAGTRTFPWRIICLSREDREMADNDAVWCLASPCQDYSAFDWVRPGKVAWDWLNNWNIRGLDFVPGINTLTYKHYIDFAARHGIEYILLDEGWSEYGANDLFRVVPGIDLEEIVRYARENGVGVFLWAGHYPLQKDMEKVFSHYSSMGISGFKIDFIERDDQLAEEFIEKAARTAAEYHLMLNLHGIHKPVGLQRKYPNILNYEGIFGLEQMRKKGLPDYDMVKFDVTAPFVRFVAGFADYTQGAMRNASYSNFRPVPTEIMSQGTRCRQLAEYVVFDSPMSMLCDSPTDYEKEKEALDFISGIPTVWDETRVLDGKVGEYILLARRKGETWYVGGMTDWTARDLSFNPVELTGQEYSADCIVDGFAAHKFANDFRTLSRRGSEALTFHLAPGGGFVAVVKAWQGAVPEFISQDSGPVLGFCSDSGVKIMEQDGFRFKDLNRNGVLDPYEDWRLPAEERAENLASLMTIEEIAGLMIYSSHMKVESEVPTDSHLAFLDGEDGRHILITTVKDALTAAEWSNNIQSFCEKSRLGIPANNSSDPRNYTEADGEFNAGSGGDISHWPREIGLGATFDMDIIRRHGEVISQEYRALGITTALSPQIDMATEPRWRRFYGSFTEDCDLATDIARVYCDAIQTTEGSAGGWGCQSVNAMAKHWPGGGCGEGGRDAHFGFGKYAVYPGGNFAMQRKPFTEGAFKLKGGTARAAAVMPYYTISTDQNPSGENVANGFSSYIVNDLLRSEAAYDGVVCTDWAIVKDYKAPSIHSGKPWGVETLEKGERFLKVLEAGCDQFGGIKERDGILEAYRLWCGKYGQESAEARFRLSAKRLLINIFNPGLFENPYLVPEESAKTVGCPEFVREGYEAQLKSIVMLKNSSSVLPVKPGSKVYMPLRHTAASITHWRKQVPESWDYMITPEQAGKYFDFTDNPSDADFAIVYIKSPFGNWGYSEAGYTPISLQYSDYTAVSAREHSLGQGDPFEKENPDRSYRGVTEKTNNIDDMYMVRKTKEAMGDKPVIVVVAMDRPFVPAEIEPYADALLLTFGVSNQAVLEIINGTYEPYALLPCQLPADMETVEAQCEDVPKDMRPYVDKDGNCYNFAFGMNWSGVINDSRVKRYE